MECKVEHSRHVAQFWKIFNNCYKEVNETENIFEPTGWCTGMAAANMKGLRDVYGYDIISQVKGCEFHYSQSVEKHSQKFQEHDINMFKVLANKLLTSKKREAYNAAFDDISKIQDTKTLFLIRKTSHKIIIVKPNIFYIIHDT